MSLFTKAVIVIIILFTTSLAIQAQPDFTLNDEISSVLFNPAKVYLKSDSVMEGYSIIAWPFYNLTVYTDSLKGDVVSEDDYKVIYAKDTRKVELKGKIFYPVTVRGSAGIYTFMHKLYENNSLIFYAGHDTKEKLIAEGKTVIFIKHKNDEKAERMIINFSEFDKTMPKKIIRNIGECEALEKAVNSGKYKKSVDDFIKMLDIYDQECASN